MAARPAAALTPRPRKTGRPSQDDAQALTERIIETATGLFLKDGFEATSFERVARDAGVSKRTLYSRFESKSELFHAVVDSYTTRNVRTILPLQDPGASTIDKLIHICLETLDIVLNTNVIALERMMMAEAERFPELALVVHDYAINHLLDPMRQVLRGGIAYGDIVIDDVENMVIMLCDVLLMGFVRRAALGLEPPGLTADKRADVERRIHWLFAGLGAKAS